MENNIFDFATKELSLDAFVCWCINWVNYNNEKRKNLGLEYIELLSKNKISKNDIKSIKISTQFCKKVTFEEKDKNENSKMVTVAVKPDVLINVEKKDEKHILLIIEDKTYTSEHDNQIARYKSGIKELVKNNNEKNEEILKGITNDNIYTVYQKIGFWYDCDKNTGNNVDICVNGNDIMELLEKHKNINSEILLSYIEHLKNLKIWYKDNGDYLYAKNKIPIQKEPNHWLWNISKQQIAQYNLMNYFFNKRNIKEHYIYHGSNMGDRPWTEYVIYSKNKIYDIFLAN